MSRRQHVVRTDDKGGVGNPRALGGGEVLCATADCGELHAGTTTTVASITIEAASDYRRCAVDATMDMSATPAKFSKYWYVTFSAFHSYVGPRESPRYPITAADGIPLVNVTWYGLGFSNTPQKDGASIELWMNDYMILRYVVPERGTVNGEQPIDLTDRNIVLYPGNEIYFKAPTGIWNAGWEGHVGFLGPADQPDYVNLDWYPWWSR